MDRTLVSFDIDGTLETGDPAGPLTAEFVRWVRAQGHLIGSCSDRTLGEQQQMWAGIGIEPDFVSVKMRLDEVRERFSCARYVHVGDTQIDAHCAALAE